jgi:hypothetical protein
MKRLIKTIMARPHLFCDLDGVLCDFDRGCYAVTRKSPEQMKPSIMWSQLARHPNFYGTLPWMSDGKDLWEYIKGYRPTVLTGLPMGRWAAPQKLEWCSRELGPEVKVITCMARDKHRHGNAGDILIDDREKAKEPWEAMGGIFVHHISTAQTIRRLKELGF